MLGPDETFTRLLAPRIILRRMRAGDEPALLAYRNDPAVNRYQFPKARYERSEIDELVREQAGSHPNAAGRWIQLAIELRATGEMIGDVGFVPERHDPSQVRIGYSLARAHQGRGLATEAVARLLDYLFGRLRKHRVVAQTDARNRPSARLLRRMGFRKEGKFLKADFHRFEWCDLLQFAMLQEEWRRLKPKLKLNKRGAPGPRPSRERGARSKPR